MKQNEVKKGPKLYQKYKFVDQSAHIQKFEEPWIKILKDITKRKVKSQKLKHKKPKLKDLTGKLAGDLKLQKEKASVASSAKQ